MTRAARSRMLVAAIPAGAVLTIAFALLGAVGAIPRVPVVTEVAGLGAILLAPGVAVEPALRGSRWSVVERFGLAAALSSALTALAGVGLHLAGLAVSPANVLVVLLLASATVGAVSMRFRHGRPLTACPKRARPEVLVGFGSLVLLVACFAAVVVVGPAPTGLAMEIMVVDAAYRLITMPLQSGAGGTSVTVAIRSTSSAHETATLAVAGDGVGQWSTPDVAIGPAWTTVSVPIATARSGRIRATVTATSADTQLTLPIELDVAP